MSGLETKKADHLFYHLVLASRTINVEPLPTVPVKNFVASKTGDKFHVSSCIWANHIKKQNRIWFQTEQDALNTGYEMHDCSVIVHKKRTKKISQHNKEMKALNDRIVNIENLFEKIKSSDNYDEKRLAHLEIKLKINKARFKRMCL